MSTQPARGTRDFLPDDVRRREHVIRVVRDVYERYGFEPLETPAFENIEILLGKYGDEGNKLIFKILRRGDHEGTGEADLALRYDLTVPLARVVAQYQNALPKFFKRYQIQPVWRADRPARGRFREFYQCDIDAVGSTSLVVEAELLGAVSEVLTRLGFGDFRVRLNHRQLLTALLESAGVGAEMHGDALVALDKLDRIGRDGVEEEFTRRGIASQAATMLVDVLRRTAEIPGADPGTLEGEGGRNTRMAEELVGFVGAQQAGVDAVQALTTIVSLAEGTPAAGRIRIDPSLARGLSYYTGAIMEIAVPDLAGSLGGGGRYDNLVGMFLGREVPACGFSLGLERIIVVMTERAMFPGTIAGDGVDVMVTLWNEASRGEAVALAGELRRGGLRVDVYPEPDRLGRQFKYASSRNVPFVTILGDDERARGNVSIKDLRSGDQASVPRGEAVGYLRTRRP
jgi:histidyl-tRNA synthetase